MPVDDGALRRRNRAIREVPIQVSVKGTLSETHLFEDLLIAGLGTEPLEDRLGLQESRQEHSSVGRLLKVVESFLIVADEGVFHRVKVEAFRRSRPSGKTELEISIDPPTREGGAEPAHRIVDLSYFTRVCSVDRVSFWDLDDSFFVPSDTTSRLIKDSWSVRVV